MQLGLELLAPARNKDIGIAAIDCGADAVYIAGPSFGAREAAGNPIQEIGELVRYAHRFGARIYLTLNTILYDHELEEARQIIIQAYEAGVDAIIIQDLGILKMELPPIELHASTQCNIRTVNQARFIASLGFRKMVLARELSLEQIREIRRSVTGCELECFIHGALCVSYSGQCYMSEYLTGRSANRGCCIQACRSKYDLTDGKGNILLRNKPVLSLKDLSLIDRIGAMAEAGVTSFKIEGRLKNISYVRNVVRSYSLALDQYIAGSESRFRRASWGTVQGGFVPNLNATFSRGFTRYFIDGEKGQWNSGDAPRSVGEPIGKVEKILSSDRRGTLFTLRTAGQLKYPVINGDGLCFISSSGEIGGMRVETAAGNRILIRQEPALRPGTELYRNWNRTFETELENSSPERLLKVMLDIATTADSCTLLAICENGKTATREISGETARNSELSRKNLIRQMEKKSGIFQFSIRKTEGEECPFIPLSELNQARRELAEELSADDDTPRKNCCCSIPLAAVNTGTIVTPDRKEYLNCSNRLSKAFYEEIGIHPAPAFELQKNRDMELMRTRYCIRHELGLCPKMKKGTRAEPLYLNNNGSRMKVEFDCARCEMSIRAMPRKDN